MKHGLRTLVVTATTFALGCGIYFVSEAVRLFYWRNFAPLSYCQLARNAESYHNRDIYVKAQIVFSESGIYVFEDCDDAGALTASVEIGENRSLVQTTNVEDLLLIGQKPYFKTAQALIEGRFRANATPGCWAPKFRIDAKTLQLISSVTDYTPPHMETRRNSLQY